MYFNLVVCFCCFFSRFLYFAAVFACFLVVVLLCFNELLLTNGDESSVLYTSQCASPISSEYSIRYFVTQHGTVGLPWLAMCVKVFFFGENET